MTKNNTKKWLLLLLVATTMLVCNSVSAQENDKWNFTGYTRGSGFVVRPELYNGLFANLGYQINPYIQLSGGLGVGFDGGFATTIGARAYTSKTKWVAMFDYHFGVVWFQGMVLTRHTIVGGASYKDLDFGAGLLYITNSDENGFGLSLTIGYNIRCYKHR